VILFILTRVHFQVPYFLSDFFCICETVYKIYTDHTLKGNVAEFLFL
jgi:hypothetical protein